MYLCFQDQIQQSSKISTSAIPIKKFQSIIKIQTNEELFQAFEDALTEMISFKEKIQLGVHKKICDACANYEKQSLIIEEGINHENTNPDIKIDIEQFKKSTLEKIKK